MNSGMGAFALRQLLASTAVVGPILILIGLCYYLFKQDKKSVFFYLGAGLLLTVIGVVCLYSEFSVGGGPGNAQDRAEAIASNPAQL